MKNKIHTTAEVNTNKLGSNVSIWQYSVILDGCHIGDNVNINAHCLVEGDVYIGNNVTIKSGVYIWNGTTVKDNVFIGPNVTFSNDKYPRSKNTNFKLEKTILEDSASIGAGSVILPGIKVGHHSMIGAGSVITKDIPPHSIVIGNPFKIIGYICSCGLKVDKKFCPTCKKEL